MSGQSILNLDILDNGLVELSKGNGMAKRTKYVEFKDVTAMLSSFASISTPLLSRDTLKYGMRDGRIRLLFEFDDKIYNQKFLLRDNDFDRYARNIGLDDFQEITEEFDDGSRADDRGCDAIASVKLYLPKAVMGVELYQEGQDWKINFGATRLYYHFDPILTNNTQLYQFPYGNIYDSHNMCFGSIDGSRRYNAQDLRGVSSLMFSWLNAESNNDLGFKVSESRSFYDGLKRISEIINKRDLKAISETEDYGRLTTYMQSFMSSAGKTFGRFLSEFM